MQDKIFELLTKLYSEFSEFKSDMNSFREDITEKVQKNSDYILKLEHELKNDIKALYDGYILTYEKLQEHDKRFDVHDKRFDAHDKRFDAIESKLEKLEVRI